MKALLVGVALLLAGCATSLSNYSTPVLITTVASQDGLKTYPVYEPPTSNTHPEVFKALFFVAKRNGLDVAASRNLDALNAWGLYVPGHIFLNPELQVDGAAAVLAHELAHAMTPMLQAPDDDIVAEGVAYIVCGRLGLDITDTTLSYYFHFQSDFHQTETVLMRNSADITRVSNFILREVQKVQGK